MKSVLYIGVGNPWRGGAGYLVRQNMFLQALAEVAQITLALFDCDDVDIPPFAAGILPLERPFDRPTNRWKNLLADLVSPVPRMHRGDNCDKPISQIEQLNLSKFDAIFAYRIDFARFAGVLNHPRLILDVDDPEHLRQADRAKNLDGGKIDWRTRFDLQKLRRYEMEAVKNAKAAFVCQEVDAKAFFPYQVFVVPNCVEVPRISAKRIEGSEKEVEGGTGTVKLMQKAKILANPPLVFVGNMSGGEGSPNGDAAKWFVDKIWPVIREEMSCKCLFVGGIDEGLRRHFSGIPGLEVLGFVEDISEIYGCGPVCIAPVRYGTGTRIKILEAMAYGCAVVSTTKGCEGLKITPKVDIFVGDSEVDFAKACVSLLQDSTKRNAVGNAGRELILQRYSQEKQHEELVKLLSQILS